MNLHSNSAEKKTQISHICNYSNSLSSKKEMTIDEFEPEDVLLEISRKLSNVSIHKLPAHGGTVEKDAVSVGQYGVFHDVQDPI